MIRMRTKIFPNPPRKNTPKKERSQRIKNTVTISLNGLGNILINQSIKAKTKISCRPIAFPPMYKIGEFTTDNTGSLTTPRSQRITRKNKI